MSILLPSPYRIIIMLSGAVNTGKQRAGAAGMQLLASAAGTIGTRLLPFCVKREYSRRNSSNFDNFFKVVKSKSRTEDQSDSLGVECGPNWELLAPNNNRFYLKNAIGPAWQGASTTMNLEIPLEALVDIEGTAGKASEKGQFIIDKCPSLIRQSLHELFPVAEVISSQNLALITLRFNGEYEQCARKFVLAAREITARLRLQDYWADFMNPFSGKPFYSWANGKNLYKVDKRFRGLNVKLETKNQCTLIGIEDSEHSFSGAIYSNAPTDNITLKLLITEQI